MYGAVSLMVNGAERGSDEGIAPFHEAIQMGPQEPEAQGEKQHFADPVEDIQPSQDLPGLRQSVLALAQYIGAHAHNVVADVCLPIDLTHRRVEEVLIQEAQLTAHLLEALVSELPPFRCVVLQQLQTHGHFALDIE